MSDLSISRPAERLTALDVMRGIAVCGILLVNIPGMGQSFMLFRPPLPAMLGSADWQSFIVSELFIKGAMRGLFTLLFGASLILMTRGAPDKADPLRAADIYLRRSLGLMALGLVNVLVLLWPGDILFTYGVCGLLLFTFRKASPAVLASMAAALLIGVTATQALSAYGHARSEAETRLQTDPVSSAPGPGPAAGAALHARPISTADPASAETAAETSQRHGGWVSLVTWSGRAWGGDTLGRQGVMVIAESLAFMMLGMLLLQTGVLAGERSTRFYLGMAAAGYALSLAIRGWRLWALWKGGFQPEVWEPALAFEAGRLAITLGHLGAILALWRANLLRALAGPLAAMGKMALTNYLGQSLIGAALFYGLGLHGRFDRWQLWAIAAAIWAAQGVFCVWWLSRYRMGPVEWLLRCGSHGALLPIRHPSKAAIQIAA